MRKDLSLKRGLDLKIAGDVTPGSTPVEVSPGLVAIVPDDFPGLTPKTEVREGDVVKIGTPLLRDKNDENVKIVSPVNGTVEAVVRGARRKIERVVVSVASGSESTAPFVSNASSPEAIKETLQRSGLWAMMRRRPYDIIPADSDMPRDIFVTALDTAPLAVMPSVSSLDAKALELGVRILSKLTTGNVYVSVPADGDITIEGAIMVDVKGPHPAGNVGIQIANIAPVNKGETIWTLDVVILEKIGLLFGRNILDMSATVAITGSEITTPAIVKTVIGADMKSILDNRMENDPINKRVIAGNVLTGVHSSLDDFIHYPYRQVTVIPEGDNADEFMGWASFSPGKMSVNRSFPGRFLHRLFKPDARINGGRRAMIMSGEYDKVLPMDILPEYLFKAIIAGDIDRMEQLGIYEIAPEDVALCEYVDPSKLELQKLVRDGLDMLRREEA